MAVMDILFWSGGKDAFLAHEFFCRQHPRKSVRLLTTYEETTRRVPHQNIPLASIEKQAEALGAPLITVALPSKCSNEIYLQKIEKTLGQHGPIDHLIFGDWYLQDIRHWREEQFQKMGFECLFPIWEKSVHELLPLLFLKPVSVRISAVADEFRKFICVGESYNQSFVQQLPGEIDPMGEKGEFHTEVIFE